MPAPHYMCLGLCSNETTAEEIRSAYRKAALIAHPDKGGSAAEFLRVVRAFEVLSDPALKSQYDAEWGNNGYSSSGSESGIDATLATSRRPGVKASPRKRHCSEVPKESATESRLFGARRSDNSILTADVLDKLFHVIGGAPISERRQLVMLVSHTVQKSLLSRFGKQKPRENDGQSCSLASSLLALEDDSSSSSASEPSLPPVLHDTQRNTVFTEENSRRGGRGVSRLRGISRRSFKSGVPLYSADIALQGFRARTRLFENLEAAVECHITLMTARRAVCQDVSSGTHLEDSIRRHFSPLIDGSNTIRFFVQLHSHAVIGRKLYSPENYDLEKALNAFSRLRTAMREGWQCLRETWINIQLEQGWDGGTRGRGRAIRTRDDLENMTRLWEADDSERRKRMLQRQERRAERMARIASQEEERRVRAMERRARRVLVLSARYEDIALKAERHVQRQKDVLARQRLAWHRRSDLTMEDIMKGPPM